MPVLAGVIHGDEKKPEAARLGVSAFGPDETGFAFAEFSGTAVDIERLRVRGMDQDDKVRFELDVGSGSTLLYDLESGPGEDTTARAARAKACIAPIETRLHAGGHFDTKIRATPNGLLRVEIPAHSIDGGADLAPLVHASGAIEIRALAKANAETRARKKEAITAWRAARTANRRYQPSTAAERLVLEAGYDGSQPYHFQLVTEDETTNGFNRTMFSKVAVAQPDDDIPTLELTWAPGAQARFDGWREALGGTEVALLLHGEHYAVLDEDSITDDGLSVEVRGWPCRPLSTWATQLASVMTGPALPASPRLHVRVNYEPGPKGSFEIFAPMDREGSLTVEVSAPGTSGVENVRHTRKHVPGHFMKYYFITTSYLGGRQCGLVPIELAVWKKYQEAKDVLLSFNVCITLTHHPRASMAVMAGYILGEWRMEEKEVMRRIDMATKLEQPERRWATVQALRDRGVHGRADKANVLERLEAFLGDDNERVRVAAAAARTKLGGAEATDADVLAKAAASKDPWVRWAIAQGK